MMPIVSIVIPCFNSGQYLPDALGSIKAYKNKSVYEVIIVDDGSTDLETLALLESLQDEDYVVLRQENKGPAAARNTGAAYSTKEFILFLDSDNKIRPSYISSGLAVMQANSSIGVVYGNAAFFGDNDMPRFSSGPFIFSRLIQSNYIDMCSLVRRKVWEEVGGLDEARVLIGHEDWDFWVRISQTNWKFHFIDEVLFDYRIRGDSLVRQATVAEKFEEMLHYFYGKHWQILLSDHKYLSEQHTYYVFDRRNPFRSFLKYLRNNAMTKR